MSYSPSTAVLALYAQMDANMSALSPPNTVLHTGPGRDVATGSYLHIDAMMDAMFSCFGYQGQNDQSGSPGYSASTTTYTNFYSSWSTSINLPVTVSKNFLLMCEVGGFIVSTADNVFFRLLVDGVAQAGQPANTMQQFVSATHVRISFQVPVSLTGGSHNFQLQAKTTGAGIFSSNSGDGCCMTLVG